MNLNDFITKATSDSDISAETAAQAYFEVKIMILEEMVKKSAGLNDDRWSQIEDRVLGKAIEILKKK
jgi:hypothetical protein